MAIGITAVFLAGCGMVVSQGGIPNGDPYSDLIEPEKSWTRVEGSPNPDIANGLALDSAENVVVAGTTHGSIAATNQNTNPDAFLAKYDKDGQHLWRRQFGTLYSDYVTDVAIDQKTDAIYVVGYSDANFPGFPSGGSANIFIAKYGSDGSYNWMKIYGTAMTDYMANCVVAPDGSLILAGATMGTFPDSTSAGARDAFIMKLDSSGNQLWVKQFGTSGYEFAEDVGLDSAGNIYFAGSTNGVFPSLTSDSLAVGPEFKFIMAKFNSQGEMRWVAQMSAGVVYGRSLAIGVDGSPYLAGYTYGSLLPDGEPQGGDAFVVKFDPATGQKVWIREFRSSETDEFSGLASAPNGNIVAFGQTAGALEGKTSAGEYDILLAELDAAGKTIRMEQLGSAGNDKGTDIAIGKKGAVYTVTTSNGSFNGLLNIGSGDIYLHRFR